MARTVAQYSTGPAYLRVTWDGFWALTGCVADAETSELVGSVRGKQQPCLVTEDKELMRQVAFLEAIAVKGCSG